METTGATDHEACCQVTPSVTRRFGQNFAKVLKKVAKKVAKAFLATKRYIQAILWCLGPLFMAQVMAQSRKLPEISSLKIAQKLKYFTKKVQNWPFLPSEKWFIALKTKNFAHFKKQPKILPFSYATFLKKNLPRPIKSSQNGHTALYWKPTIGQRVDVVRLQWRGKKTFTLQFYQHQLRPLHCFPAYSKVVACLQTMVVNMFFLPNVPCKI